MLRNAIILTLTLTAVLTFGAAARVAPMAILAGALLFGAMATAGTAIFARVIPSDRSGLELWVFGSVLGLAMGRVALVVASLLLGNGASSVWTVVGGFIVMAALVHGRRERGLWLTPDDQLELPGLAVIACCILLTTAVAYHGVGRATAAGYAFVPYFNWDFLQHVSTTAELARAVPPENPCFAGERLQYYWLYHLWPAAIERLTGVTARDALVGSLPFNNLLFAAALTLIVRRIVPDRRARTVAVLAGVMSYSYIGLLFLATHLGPHLLRVPNLSHSASGYSQLSHSWFRDFLYEPHAVSAMTGLLTAVFVRRWTTGRASVWAGAIAGFCLACAFWTDAFVGLLGCLWYAAVTLYGVIRNRGAGELRGAMACGVAASAIIGSAIGLGALPLRGHLLGLGLHPTTKVAPLYLTIELGPLFLLGAWGVFVAAFQRGTSPRTAGTMILLIAICLAFAFLVRNPQEPNIVLRKSIKVVQIPLVIFAAIAIGWTLDAGRRRRRAVAHATMWVILLAGTITLATDLRAYTALSGTHVPPTSYVSSDEMEMLSWIRKSAPADAVVQDVSEVRPGRSRMDTWDLTIPALAERRALFANYTQPYIFNVGAGRIDDRRRRLEAVYQAPSSATLRTALEDLPPCWLYVHDDDGSPVAAAVGELRREGYLSEVHRAGAVSLLCRAPTAAAGAHVKSGPSDLPGTSATVTYTGGHAGADSVGGGP